MERIAFKVDTGESCVCRGVATLNSLVFGNGICAFVTRYGLGHAGDEALDTVFAFWFGGVKKGYQLQCESSPGEWQLLLQLIEPLQWYW
eukprot:1152466-Pelagomonas_calceolata.AAC.1